MKRKITKLLISAVSVCTLLTGCTTKENQNTTSNNTSNNSQTLTKYENVSYDVGFDTMYNFMEYTTNTETAAAHFQNSASLLRYYNQLFDIYNNYDGVNNLKTVNDNAGVQPVKVDKPIIDMLHMAKDFYDYSNGEFDITMGALLKVWHKYREEGIKLNAEKQLGNLPSEEELTQAAGCKGWDNVIINDEESTVYITQPCQSFDVGGIAKGYATELVAEEVSQHMQAGYFNVGRNIRTFNDKPDGTTWNVGIADPEGALPNGLALISSKGSFSFVTSGDYERFYIATDGKSYHHIIDPSTNYPASYYRSVTIITENSGVADCLSTTLFTLSIEDGKKVLEAYKQATGKEANAVWVMDLDKKQGEGKETNGYYVVSSEGLKDNITY